MAARPPEDLFIYELKGAVEKQPLAFGPGFLGHWVEAGYTFLFFDREARDGVQAFLEKEPGFALRYVHEMKYWQWQDGARFTPFSVGPLTIVPAWDDDSPLDLPGTIRIDPGLAFGFGGHPTTLACLESLVRIYREDPPRKVLDLGTGTGVLSLAAAALGAVEIKAVEYSHLAVQAARENVRINHRENTIDVFHGLAEDYALEPADLVCANLHHQVQQALIEQGGYDGRRWLVLSGLFHPQAEAIEQTLLAKPYRMVDRIRDPRWTTLVFKGLTTT